MSGYDLAVQTLLGIKDRQLAQRNANLDRNMGGVSTLLGGLGSAGVELRDQDAMQAFLDALKPGGATLRDATMPDYGNSLAPPPAPKGPLVGPDGQPVPGALPGMGLIAPPQAPAEAQPPAPPPFPGPQYNVPNIMGAPLPGAPPAQPQSWMPGMGALLPGQLGKGPPPPPAAAAPPPAPPSAAPPPPAPAPAPMPPPPMLPPRAAAAAPSFDMGGVAAALSRMSPAAAQRALGIVGLVTGERDAAFKRDDVATQRSLETRKLLLAAQKAQADGDFERAKFLIEEARRQNSADTSAENARVDNERADRDLRLREEQFAHQKERDTGMAWERDAARRQKADQWEREFAQRQRTDASSMERRRVLNEFDRYKSALSSRNPRLMLDATKAFYTATNGEIRSLRGRLSMVLKGLSDEDADTLNEEIRQAESRRDDLEKEMRQLAQPSSGASADDYSDDEVEGELARRGL